MGGNLLLVIIIERQWQGGIRPIGRPAQGNDVKTRIVLNAKKLILISNR